MLRLPSGRLVRGRALRRPVPPGPPPEFGVYLLGREPARPAWPVVWLRWPDFRLPADRARARDVLREAWERAATERVEVACGGGPGGTARRRARPRTSRPDGSRSTPGARSSHRTRPD